MSPPALPSGAPSVCLSACPGEGVPLEEDDPLHPKKTLPQGKRRRGKEGFEPRGREKEVVSL